MDSTGDSQRMPRGSGGVDQERDALIEWQMGHHVTVNIFVPTNMSFVPERTRTEAVR
jgi:hypothetical protein